MDWLKRDKNCNEFVTKKFSFSSFGLNKRFIPKVNAQISALTAAKRVIFDIFNQIFYSKDQRFFILKTNPAFNSKYCS